MKRTPFARKPHHKRLERSDKPMKRSPMRRGVGKSNRSQRRAEWQKEMLEKWGRGKYCEWPGCKTPTLFVANAHRLVKTKIVTREEWVDGRAHLCQIHHDFSSIGGKDENGVYHAGGHERQWRLITEIIEKRNG